MKEVGLTNEGRHMTRGVAIAESLHV